MHRHRLNSNYLRSTIFGLEDALVSTTGVVIGITAGSGDKRFILLAGLVTVAVEAISMGAGEYLSEETVEELKKGPNPRIKMLFGSFLMFFSYLFAGMIPIIPVFLLPLEQIIPASLISALTGLFIVGFLKGRVVHYSPLKSALEMLTVGGLATLVGVLVGITLKI